MSTSNSVNTSVNNNCSFSNTSFSPQDDFYLFVNNEWLQDPKNVIPDDYSSWGGFTKLHDNTIKLQISLVQDLENRKLQELTEEESKIYAIWKASHDLFHSWDKGIQDYSSLNEELQILTRHFTKKTEKKTSINSNTSDYIIQLANYLYYTQTNGIRNVIDFDTGSDLKNVNNVVLDFSIGGLSLPSSEYYYLPKFQEKKDLYQQHLKNIQSLVQSNNITLTSNFVQDVLEFETHLAKFLMTPAQSREYDQYFTNTTLENLYYQINSLRSLDSKQDNYSQEQKNFKLSSEEISNIKNFMEILYQKFDFRNILEDNLTQNFQNIYDPPYASQITAYDGDAIRRCLHFILEPKNFQKYLSYMQYRIISSCSSFCSKELDAEFFDFYQRKLGGQQHPKSNLKRSIGIVNAYSGEMLGKLFVTKHFSSQAKHDIQKMIAEVLLVMQQSLQHNDWLTISTQQKALEKLTHFRTKIGYPDVWKDYSDFDVEIGDSLYQISKKAKKWSLRVNFFEKINSVLDREEWRMTPQTVNAYFMPTQNEIVFPAAILQAPFYHQSLETVDFDIQEELNSLHTHTTHAQINPKSNQDLNPKIDKDFIISLVINSINYGGIGAVIAHEITHGYDDKGRKFDGDGNLNDWWTDEDTELFNKKTQLIIDSVSKYSYQEPVTKKIYHMNPQLTMGENLADIGGLSLSMQALLQYLNTHINATSTQNLENIVKPCLRVFFKSWANIWKQNIKSEKRTMLLSVDPHGPTDFRGNLVQHMNQFYEVFSVTEGDPMYLDPKHRMKMW